MTPPYIVTWPELAATLEYGIAARARPRAGPTMLTPTLARCRAYDMESLFVRGNVVLLCIVYVVKETTLPLWVDALRAPRGHCARWLFPGARPGRFSGARRSFLVRLHRGRSEHKRAKAKGVKDVMERKTSRRQRDTLPIRISGCTTAPAHHSPRFMVAGLPESNALSLRLSRASESTSLTKWRFARSHSSSW